MSTLARIAAAVSRRLRLAAMTVIALFAVKVAAAALAAPDPAPASAAIGSPDRSASAETLEPME